jgi:hypothetical protein
MWYDLVAVYMGCSLSMPKDKLIALSGVAKLFVGVLNDEYQSGIWKQDLPYRLLWRLRPRQAAVGCPTSGDLTARLPGEYRAPSWSWASHDGNFFPGPGYAPSRGATIVKVLEARTFTMTSEATGQVTGGFIRLECRLIDTIFHPIGKKSHGILKHYHVHEGLQHSVSEEIREDDLSEQQRRHLPFVHLEREDVLEDKTLLCMPIIFEIGERPEEQSLEGLVLESAGNEKNKYCRIGRVQVEGAERIKALGI